MPWAAHQHILARVSHAVHRVAAGQRAGAALRHQPGRHQRLTVGVIIAAGAGHEMVAPASGTASPDAQRVAQDVVEPQ